MEFLVLLPIMAIVGAFAFQAGQYTKQYPTEDEMLQRLISARASRKIEKLTAENLEREIEEKAEALVART